MPRVQPKTMPYEERRELLEELWNLVALLESREEVENFFKDLLSESESLMLARRIRAARMLLEGKSYERVAEEMKMGYSTVASVHHWLQSINEGYKTALPRLEKKLNEEMKQRQKKAQKEIARQEPLSFEWMKKKYPLHFLLFNLFEQTSKDTNKTKKKKRKR